VNKLSLIKSINNLKYIKSIKNISLRQTQKRQLNYIDNCTLQTIKKMMTDQPLTKRSNVHIT